MKESINFDTFREQWLQDVRVGDPAPAELGRRFAHKLFTQWRDVGEPSDDLIYCDGPCDGGIDIAYLERGLDDDENVSGDTWYLVQSKYGSAAGGAATIRQEGQKLIDTLSSGGGGLAGTSQAVVARVAQFVAKADAAEHGDRLVFVYATELPLSEDERRAMDDIRAVGRHRFGPVFDVEALSIETIYLNTQDDGTATLSPPIKISIEATLANSGENLMVGSVSLLSLYDFLAAYRAETENLDQLYEKNVRQFLGGRGKVNKAMRATLLSDPAQFGLYNNGITFVVSDFKAVGMNRYELTEPYVVNGCQTTRTIWEVFQQRLDSGGKGVDQTLEEWKGRAGNGVAVVKIVRVGNDNENLLQNITRYTNSQNAVREKDFITLDRGFHLWKREMAGRYGIFLEVQRGGWDAQQAYQKQHPTERHFTKSANALDLLKAYGAGWLKETGQAFARNTAFVPGGRLYRQIVEGESGEPFGVEDLYAAFRLQEIADAFEFGRGSQKRSRTQTRFLFYFVAVDLLRDVMVRANLPTGPSDLTQALLKIFSPKNSDAAEALFGTAVEVIDEYLTHGSEESVFNEPAFRGRFNNDLNAFLKWDQIGKAEATPMLNGLMAINKRTMGRGTPSPRDLIAAAVQ